MNLMPPMMAVVHIAPRPPRRRIRLWLPLFLVWLLLLPFVPVLLPVYLVVCIVMEIRPLRTLGALFGVLGGLAGTHVEVDNPRANVFIHVY